MPHSRKHFAWGSFSFGHPGFHRRHHRHHHWSSEPPPDSSNLQERQHTDFFRAVTDSFSTFGNCGRPEACVPTHPPLLLSAELRRPWCVGPFWSKLCQTKFVFHLLNGHISSTGPFAFQWKAHALPAPLCPRGEKQCDGQDVVHSEDSRSRPKKYSDAPWWLSPIKYVFFQKLAFWPRSCET